MVKIRPQSKAGHGSQHQGPTNKTVACERPLPPPLASPCVNAAMIRLMNDAKRYEDHVLVDEYSPAIIGRVQARVSYVVCVCVCACGYTHKEMGLKSDLVWVQWADRQPRVS